MALRVFLGMPCSPPGGHGSLEGVGLSMFWFCSEEGEIIAQDRSLGFYLTPPTSPGFSGCPPPPEPKPSVLTVSSWSRQAPPYLGCGQTSEARQLRVTRTVNPSTTGAHTFVEGANDGVCISPFLWTHLLPWHLGWVFDLCLLQHLLLLLWIFVEYLLCAGLYYRQGGASQTLARGTYMGYRR